MVWDEHLVFMMGRGRAGGMREGPSWGRRAKQRIPPSMSGGATRLRVAQPRRSFHQAPTVWMVQRSKAKRSEARPWVHCLCVCVWLSCLPVTARGNPVCAHCRGPFNTDLIWQSSTECSVFDCKA